MRKVGILTAGGLVPCLSFAIDALIKEYNDVSSDIEILCYKNGYMGLLFGDSVTVTHGVVESINALYKFVES